MIIKKTIWLFLCILLIGVSAIWAGDTASFVDLGFSSDGRTFMFGQYGVLSNSLIPWAEIYVVDVPSNNFVQNGKVSHTDNGPIKAGQDGSGVLYQLVTSNASLSNRYGISSLNQGLPLYISRNETPPVNGEKIEFRDFLSDKKEYTAQLFPSINGNGQSLKSSFYIKLESHSANGQVKNYTIGNPNFSRPLIASYNIKKVLIDAGGNSIIFVIEMKRIADNGYDIRYMVEVQRL